MNFRPLLPLAAALTLAACFSAVPEQPCLTDAGCTNTDGGKGGGTGTGTGGGSVAAGGGTGGSSAGGGGGSTTDGGTGGGSATGGGTGAGGGNATDGGMPCGCKNQLGCQVGDSALACGNGGATSMCAMCSLGQQCVNGACVTGMCAPGTCSGCCTMNFCLTAQGMNAFACGSGGSACAACGMGQSCVNGTCMATPACSVTTCPTGCCIANQCVTNQSRFTCGLAGQMCQQCMQGNDCNSGVCVPSLFDAGLPPPSDAGMVPVGAPCTTAQQCRPPQAAICISEMNFGQPSGYPGGYCSAQCSATMPCAGGGECITEVVFGFANSTCRAACNPAASTCRTGYVCVPSSSTGTGYCRPNCANGGLAACGTGQSCGDAGICN